MCSICREKDEFNELLHRFDFLDSVDWLGIRANMRKLHSKKTSGKTLDGANVFLEIVARDSHMQRDLLAEVKKKVRSAKRLEEVEERHRERERKRKPNRPKLAGRRNAGLSLGTRIRVLTQQALFGQASAELASDERRLLSSETDANTSSSADDPEQAATAGCFGRNKRALLRSAAQREAERKQRRFELKVCAPRHTHTLTGHSQTPLRAGEKTSETARGGVRCPVLC